jgi:hypothetical protein
MRVTMASVPKPGDRRNEDFVGAVPSAVVVVDGAGGIPGADAACAHGVAWYARRLGAHLLMTLPDDDRSLAAQLAAAIGAVTDEHRPTCDVASTASPSAMVAVVRVSGDTVDHLVLGDATVVLDRVASGPLVVTDPRELVVIDSLLPDLEVAASDEERDVVLGRLRAHRNRPGGFWLAKDDPHAADEALTGSHALRDVAGAVVLSNGASRLVDPLALTDWSGLLAQLAEQGAAGPADVIRRVREAEQRDGVPPDDATIAHVVLADRT